VESLGLKPLEFAEVFAGLKPCAPTEMHKAHSPAACEVALTAFATWLS